MKFTCENWKDQLLEAALTGATTKDFKEHLRVCPACSRDLEACRERRMRLDGLLPLVGGGAEPRADFRARVLAAAASGANSSRPWRVWSLVGAAAALVIWMSVAAIHRKAGQAITEKELAAGQKLAEWRAPSDALLVTPGLEILRTMPRLGESYLHVPVKTDEEE